MHLSWMRKFFRIWIVSNFNSFKTRFQCMLDCFAPLISHQTLICTAGSLTSVCDLFACITHTNDLGLVSSEGLCREISRWLQISLARTAHPSLWWLQCARSIVLITTALALRYRTSLKGQITGWNSRLEITSAFQIYCLNYDTLRSQLHYRQCSTLPIQCTRLAEQ